METKTLEDFRANIQEFADKFNLHYNEEGECGFGRECVGLSKNNNYVEYNPTSSQNYENIPEFYDERLLDIVPEDAYHKHDCLAVLGRGENAIRQLSEWVDKLKELNCTVESFDTGNTGIQAILSGTIRYAVKIND